MADLAGGSAPSTSTGSAPVSGGGSTPSSVVSSPSSASDLSNSSLDSAVDSLLASPSSGEGASPTPSTGDATPGATQEAPATDAGATSAAPAPEEQAPQTQAEVDLDDPDAPDDDLEAVQADSATPQNLLDLKRPRGQRIYGAYKQFKEISERLGEELTPESAQAYKEAYSDRLAMEDEFASGDPAAQQNWLQYWHGANPQAFGSLMNRMADYLAASDANAYVAMAQPVINRFLNQLYVNAQREQNAELKKAMTYTARMVDYYLNGDYRKDEQLPRVPDNLTQREQAIQAQMNQINQFNRQQAQSQLAAWNQSLDSANDSALSAETTKALEPLKSTLTDRLFKAAERDFREAIRDHISKDVEGNRIYNIQRNQTMRAPTQDAVAALASAYSQRVSRAVRTIGPRFLKEAGVAAQKAATQRQTALQASADAGRGVQTQGAPTTQSVLPSPQQFASRGEQMEASIDAILGTGSARR